MMYSKPPPGTVPEPRRVRFDSGRYWAAAGATAIVAALVALVGILVSRWTLGIPILAPAADGAVGSARTAEYVLMAVLVTAVAAVLLYLLVLAAPQPRVFIGWIMGLATLAAVVFPFSTSAPLDQQIATAVVNFALGIAITSLLSVSAALAARPPVPPRMHYMSPNVGYIPDRRYPPERWYEADPRYGNDPRYGTDPRYGIEPEGYETIQPEPEQDQDQDYETPQTRPPNAVQDPDQRRWN